MKLAQVTSYSGFKIRREQRGVKKTLDFKGYFLREITGNDKSMS